MFYVQCLMGIVKPGTREPGTRKGYHYISGAAPPRHGSPAMWEMGNSLAVSRKVHRCHPERSEGSLSMGTKILRCAQDDKTFPILLVNVHHRAATHL